MEDYRITYFDPSNMTATIQFGNSEPFNHALPIINGKLPAGELLAFWVAMLYQGLYETRDAEIPNVTNAAEFEALVNPNVLPYTVQESTYTQPASQGLEPF